MSIQHGQLAEQCGICGRVLNQPGVIQSWDCAGHCLQCMADSEDPDCIEILTRAKDPNSSHLEMARYEEWRIKQASNPIRLGIILISKGRSRQAHDADLIACLREHRVHLVCLAGYMRLLSPAFIAAFPNRILNIHPSLLPAFPGLDAQQQAFDYGVKIAGCTVHFVDEHLDHGVIILQRSIPVLDSDDAHSLAQRILAEEHIAYSQAIARVVSGQYEIRNRRYVPRKL